MFSIKFSRDTNQAQLFSPLATWCDNADWDSDSKKLSIPINFGNDLGDFELCWEWVTDDGERHSASFSSQVFSIKFWIFDAKYRLNGNNAPDDAINQMHRYRDAVVWSDESSGTSKLTRESIGAYILYPSTEQDLSEKSPQIDSIDKTNIGAFPLHPSFVAGDAVPVMLRNRLNQFFTIKNDYSYIKETQSRYFAAVPIIKHITNDIFAKCITKSAEKMNTANYWKKCRLYRLPDRVVQKEELTPNTWTYLVPTAKDGMQLGIFPILGVARKQRDKIIETYIKSGIVLTT